jgi:uncharacterized membrane protein YfcA
MELASFDLLQWAFFALVVTGAFAVRSATGFGSSMVVLPLAALAFPVQAVIPVVSGLQVFSNVTFSVRHWRDVIWEHPLRVMPAALLGIGAGLYLFYLLDTRLIAKGVGAFVIGYALHAMATAGRTEAGARSPPWLVSASLNASGGLVGALFGGASSPFYVMYLRALNLSRDAFRATMTMIILIQAVLRLGGYAGLGFVTADILLIVVLAVPFVMLGGKLGDVLAQRVSPLTFNRMVGVLLLASGVALLVK